MWCARKYIFLQDSRASQLSTSPKKLSVPINFCVHTFRVLSWINYAIPAVSRLFAYIVVLIQTPIDRDIGICIEYIQISEWYRRVAAGPLH